MEKIISFIKEDGSLEIVETFEHKIVLKTSIEDLYSYTDFKDNLEIMNGFMKKESLKYLESQLYNLLQKYHLIEGDFYLKVEQKLTDMENIYFIIEKDLSKIAVEEILINPSITEVYILETTITLPGEEDKEFSEKTRVMECFLNDSYIKELFKKEANLEHRINEYRVFKAVFKGKFLNQRASDLSKMVLIDSLPKRDLV